MATKIVTKNSSTAGAAPTATDLVQGELAVNVADGRLYTEDNAAAIVELGVNPATEITANAGIALPDSQKATFGAGDDLQIYHDGSSSFIKDAGTGNLIIQATDLQIANADNTANYIRAFNGGAVDLRYAGSAKIATTATGINVTGTASATSVTSTQHLTAGSAYSLLFGDGGERISGNNSSSLLNFFTGATERMRIDASGKVGIGTSSPAQLAHLSGAGTQYMRVENTTNSVVSDFGTTSAGTAIINRSAHPIDFYTDTVRRMTIGATGNVGIGVTDPIYPLEVQGEAGIELYNASGGGGVLNLRPSLGDANKYNMSISSYDHSGGGVGPADGISINAFDGVSVATGSSTARQERLRIDSSGNLLVGTTSVQGAGGVTLSGAGYVYSSRPSSTAIYADRTGSDGAIQEFRKDGTSVGNIGTDTGTLSDLYIAGGDTGIGFADAAVDRIIPCGATGAVRDDAIDLGRGGERWRDLYLGGGVYLGGTGADNKLDDYEIGSFTPVIADAASGGNVASGYANQYGYYTKVGRLVTCVFDLTNIATVGMTGTNDIYIRDLPFTASGHPGAPQFTAPVIGGGTMTAALSLYAALQDNGVAVRLMTSNQTSISAFLNVSNINSGGTDLRFSITYFAA